MGEAVWDTAAIPAEYDGLNEIVDQLYVVGGTPYRINVLSVGNPHCVVFLNEIDQIPLEKTGPQFEYAAAFPDRTNTEFVRVVDPYTLRLRVWERGNGATLACGTGACAAVAAAVRLGYCSDNTDIHVKLPGGDMIVRSENGRLILTGGASVVFEGSFEY
jgi:carbamoyl-phosphate synthase large subunit